MHGFVHDIAYPKLGYYSTCSTLSSKFPIMRRILTVTGCSHVSDVLIDAPAEPDEDMIARIRTKSKRDTYIIKLTVVLVL